jgi:hypothetical protein
MLRRIPAFGNAPALILKMCCARRKRTIAPGSAGERRDVRPVSTRTINTFAQQTTYF